MNTSTKTINFVFAPISVAILIYISDFLWLSPFLAANRFQDMWIFTVVSNLALRIAIGIWTVSLTKEHKLHQTLWVILGLIFGLIQLVVINLVIWFKPLFKKE